MKIEISVEELLTIRRICDEALQGYMRQVTPSVYVPEDRHHPQCECVVCRPDQQRTIPLPVNPIK